MDRFLLEAAISEGFQKLIGTIGTKWDQNGLQIKMHL